MAEEEILPKLHPVHQKIAKKLAAEASTEYVIKSGEQILREGAINRYGEKGDKKLAEVVNNPESREIIESGEEK